jgi:hypothetical protein
MGVPPMDTEENHGQDAQCRIVFKSCHARKSRKKSWKRTASRRQILYNQHTIIRKKPVILIFLVSILYSGQAKSSQSNLLWFVTQKKANI